MVAHSHRASRKGPVHRAASPHAGPPTPSERAASIRESVRHGEVKDLGPLLVALSDPVPGVRETAAVALGI
ncbi:MAG: hypothetical protein WBW40_06840, partial [Thermoplasmata archaeon]